MARGVKALDFVSRDGQRHYQVTRMDGQPVDVEEWKAELKITDPKMVTAEWPEEHIPGCWHRLFVWYPNPHLTTPHPTSPRGGEG